MPAIHASVGIRLKDRKDQRGELRDLKVVKPHFAVARYCWPDAAQGGHHSEACHDSAALNHSERQVGLKRYDRRRRHHRIDSDHLARQVRLTQARVGAAKKLECVRISQPHLADHVQSTNGPINRMFRSGLQAVQRNPQPKFVGQLQPDGAISSWESRVQILDRHRVNILFERHRSLKERSTALGRLGNVTAPSRSVPHRIFHGRPVPIPES